MRLSPLLGLSLATACIGCGPAAAVTLTQHSLAGPYSPAFAVQGSADGLEIARIEGQSSVILQHVSTSPRFTLGAVQHDPALTLGVGPDGDLWLVGTQQQPGNVVDLSLEDLLPTGALQTRYRFPAPLGSAAWPQAFAAGPDGSLWVVNRTAETIERIAPSGAVTGYSLPRAGAPMSIAPAPDGSVWFTELATGTIGEITPEGTVVEHEIGDGDSFGGFGTTEPYSIVLGPDGAMWFTEQNSGRIGRMTESGQLQEFTIPATAHLAPGEFGMPAPRELVVGPEGALWFTDPGDESIGRITMSGETTEYPIPSAMPASPQGMTSYSGEIWFAEAGVDAIGSVDPAGATATGAPAVVRPAAARAADRTRCCATPAGRRHRAEAASAKRRTMGCSRRPAARRR